MASILPDQFKSILSEDALNFAKIHGSSLLSLLLRTLRGTDGIGSALADASVELIVHNWRFRTNVDEAESPPSMRAPNAVADDVGGSDLLGIGHRF